MPHSSDGRSIAPPLLEAASEAPDSVRPSATDREPHIPLRLAVTRGALGLELYEAVEIGPIQLSRLALSLPGLKFPLDLSGGVPVFRNRRGHLERVELELSLDNLAHWSKARLNEVIGPLLRPVAFWCAPPSLSVGFVSEGRALAFDLLWAPDEQDARLVVANARGSGLQGAALGFALRAVDSLFGRVAKRAGRVLRIERVGASIARSVLPALGVRAPSAAELRFGEISARGDALTVALDASFLPPAISAEAVSALEVAELVRDADEALARGDSEQARAGFMRALESAPRHPELSRLIAEIDFVLGNRTEAALSILNEAQPLERAGLVGAELLAQVGDRDAAREVASQAARLEPYGPLAALVFRRISELEGSVDRKLAALDQGVARAPALADLRWARLALRLSVRDVQPALGDAEHLEASATGSRARYEVCRRAAREFLLAGFVREAGKLYERALRYVPDDAEASAGLGRAFIELGRMDRAVALLERAVLLAERTGHVEAEALLDLAKLLAKPIGDLPQAIARLRQIPASSGVAVEARALEGRFRAALGDIVGASLAYARALETIELKREFTKAAGEWLHEAARFERNVTSDVIMAERHLSLALRILPDDADTARAYREVAALVARKAGKLPA